MLKIRYFSLKLPCSISEFSTKARRHRSSAASRIAVVRDASDDLVLTHTSVRYVTVTQIADDGTITRESVPTMDQTSLRIFGRGDRTFLSVLNPGRSVRSLEQVIQQVVGDDAFFYQPLEITRELIDRHVARFETARLVSAKVRDFKVYDEAVGRLEISSKSGLQSSIAPFLDGKFYRIDALAYEVTHDFTQALIWYSSSGTLRVSGPLVEVAFPLFEEELQEKNRA